MRSATSCYGFAIRNSAIIFIWLLATGTTTRLFADGLGVEAVGPLIIIGGAENSDGRVLKQVAQMAGGEQAHLVIVPVASEEQQAAFNRYEKDFRALGVKDIRPVILNTREDACDEENIRLVAQATGVFFSGGDQSRIVQSLRDTPLSKAISDRNAQGVVLAGTSAGAAMMSRRMIRSGLSNAIPAPGIVDVGPGMTLIRGVLIDQHFSQRGRQGRLLSALAERPQTLGVGIDENTALVVDNAEFRVVGAGAVYVYDVSHTKYNLNKSDRGDSLALAGVVLHAIPGGFRFHLQGRTPVIEGEAPFPLDR